MRFFAYCSTVLALLALATAGCDVPQGESPVLKLFYGSLFARGTGKTANLEFSVTVNEGDTEAKLPLLIGVAGRVANIDDNCAADNKGWNADITISATPSGYGLTGTAKEKDACKSSTSRATYLSMNIAIDNATSVDQPSSITGAFPPGSGSDIVVSDLVVHGTDPQILIDGRLRLNSGDAPVTITVDASGVVTGVVEFPGNNVTIDGTIDLVVLGQVPAKTLATSLLMNAIVMSRY